MATGYMLENWTADMASCSAAEVWGTWPIAGLQVHRAVDFCTAHEGIGVWTLAWHIEPGGQGLPAGTQYQESWPTIWHMDLQGHLANFLLKYLH